MRRRLLAVSGLVTLSLALAAAQAAAQYGYPPGGYRSTAQDYIIATDPDEDDRGVRRPSPRQQYEPPVESQPLAPLANSERAPYPHDGRQGLPGDQPVGILPPPPDRYYGARPPAYGAAPSGEAPAPGGSYPGSPYPGANVARPDDPRYAPRPPAAVEGGYRPYAGAPADVPGRSPQLAALPPEDQPETGEPKELPPQFRRQVVSYQTREPAGTIVIDTPSTFLYYVNGDGTAIRYGIGVGREGFTWAGTERISRMAEWPDWHPPAEMIERQPYLPRFMAGGASNPLGARALYLGRTIYRIHGTNQPSTIGQFVSSGCIRMLNEDVEDLYTRVKIGTKVVVIGDGKRAPTAAATR